MKHYYPRDPKTNPTSINGIPFVVYMSWGHRTLPLKMRQTIEANMKSNPEFDFYIYSDEDCRKFIAENYDAAVVAAFDGLKPGAYKSDLWRYCVLYRNGGVYMDIKMKVEMPLKKQIETYGTLFTKDYLAFDILDGVWNGYMIAPQGTPVFKDCIDNIVDAVKTKSYRRNFLDVTGPHLLGRTIEKYPDLLNKKTAEIRKTDDWEVSVHDISSNSLLLTEYPEYRDEQKLAQKTEHYQKMYAAHDIFT